MRKYLKRLLSIVCVLAMVTSLNLSVAAAGTESSTDIVISQQEVQNFEKMLENFSDEELRSFLLENYASSEEEVEDFLAVCSNQVMPLGVDFPENPYIGQRYTATLVFDVVGGATALEIAGDIVKDYNIKWGLALMIAGFAADVVSTLTGVYQIKAEVEYVYLRDDNGELRWVYGPNHVSIN